MRRMVILLMLIVSEVQIFAAKPPTQEEFDRIVDFQSGCFG